MQQEIKNSNLSQRVAEAIGDSKIHAALFCTYTFRRTFFEDEIYEALLCSHGQLRGSFPVTVIVDADNFMGQGWGYDVCLFPFQSLWHPKLYVFMLQDSDGSSRTSVFIGSGNLTPSGWEKNLEIFQYFEWSDWALPSAVKSWAFGNQAFARSSRFGRWYTQNHWGTVPSFTDRRIITSFGNESIWDQWEWSDPWTKAFIVAPYTDQTDEEVNDDIGDYLSKTLTEYARSKSAALDVYLQGASEDRVYGYWPIFKSLQNKVRLRVYRVGGDTSRRLHAKLQIIYSKGTYYVLGGSPNASTAAMTRSEKERGNVELAWMEKCEVLPKGILPNGALS